MRNKLNEVKEFDIISICDTIRIAMFDEPYPYIVPVNFGEEIIGDQVVFYIHTDYEGKKNDLLAKNPNIAFEMDCNHELYYRESNMSCNFRYESVGWSFLSNTAVFDAVFASLRMILSISRSLSQPPNPMVRINLCISFTLFP